MGASISHPVYTRVSNAIPPVKQMATDENWNWVDTGPRAFVNAADRHQFVHTLVLLLTQNATLNLGTNDFKLLYSRRPSPQTISPASHTANATRVVATLVATHPITGAVVAKIEPGPDADGANVNEAFQAFRRDVEVKLEEMLRGVMSAVGQGGGGGSPGGVVGEAPPAYEGDGKT